MQSLTVYHWIERYLTNGHQYLRQNRGEPVVEAIVAGQMMGVDTMRLARMCANDIDAIDRLLRQLRSVRLGVKIRLCGIVLASFVVRCLLLFSISDNLWAEWTLLDRVACLALMIITGCVVYLWHLHHVSSDPLEVTRSFLNNWVKDYMILSPRGAGDEALALRLGMVRISEIREGVDGRDLSQRFYLQALAEHTLRLRRHLERWPMMIMAMELAFFLIYSSGLGLVPFVAWLETASSGS